MPNKRKCKKKPYKSQTEAVSAMIRLAKIGLGSYKCGQCNAWHLGNRAFGKQRKLDNIFKTERFRISKPE